MLPLFILTAILYAVASFSHGLDRGGEGRRSMHGRWLWVAMVAHFATIGAAEAHSIQQQAGISVEFVKHGLQLSSRATDNNLNIDEVVEVDRAAIKRNEVCIIKLH